MDKTDKLFRPLQRAIISDGQ